MRDGRPPLPRAVQVVFWEAVRAGLSAEEGGRAAGVSHRMPYRWLSRAGGVKSNGPGPVSGRYLSLAEREEIAVGVAAGDSLRLIAARLGRAVPPGTREDRRDVVRGRHPAGAAQARDGVLQSAPKKAELCRNV